MDRKWFWKYVGMVRSAQLEDVYIDKVGLQKSQKTKIEILSPPSLIIDDLIAGVKVWS